MAFFKNHITKTEQKEIIENKTTNKVFVVTLMRINNENDAPYKFSLFLRENETQVITPLSVDELDAGDYIVDDTQYLIPPGYALLDQTDVDTETVKVVINGEYKPYEKGV